MFIPYACRFKEEILSVHLSQRSGIGSREKESAINVMKKATTVKTVFFRNARVGDKTGGDGTRPIQSKRYVG